MRELRMELPVQVKVMISKTPFLVIIFSDASMENCRSLLHTVYHFLRVVTFCLFMKCEHLG